MNFSDDDKHRETLEVLRETLDYLQRMPPHPMTKAFCARLQAHLDEPTQRLVAQGQRELHGRMWTPVGLPLLEASLAGETLTIQVPDNMTGNMRKWAIQELGERLKAGQLKIGLESPS